MYRSSRLEVVCKKGVLKNLTKFTGKHLCPSIFFNKVAGLRPATLLKKKTLAQVFSCEFCQTLRKTLAVASICSYSSPPCGIKAFWNLIQTQCIFHYKNQLHFPYMLNPGMLWVYSTETHFRFKKWQCFLSKHTNKWLLIYPVPILETNVNKTIFHVNLFSIPARLCFYLVLPLKLFHLSFVLLLA